MSKKVNGMIADNPKLMAFFDAENNPGIDPHQLSAGSAKKINWNCRKCGYKFERSVRKFLARPECPCCEIGSVVVRGINDVFTLVPQLKASYDFEKNKDIDIYSLSPASRIPVYWKCPDCGKESFSAIASRVRKQKDGTYHVAGCMNCSAIKSKKRKNGKPVYLSDDPETLRFYDRENNTIRPEGLSVNSGLPRNWKCPDCGYKWVATVKNMCKIKNKCPACREVNKQKLKEHPAGKRDLFTVVPEARRYYDFEANGDYDISNHYYRDNKKQLYWKCPDCGYSWKSTSLVHLYKKDGKWRWKGGCMRCAKKGKKYFKESVASKEFLMNIWDEEKNEVAPESISAYSDQSAFWNCRKCGYKWQRTIRKTTNSNGRCPHCEDKTEVMRGVDDVLTVVPDLEQFIDKSYDYSDIYRADVTSGIHIHWKCPKCGRKWESEIRHRLKKYEDGTYGVIGCTSCGYMSERNYAERYPDVAAMYDKKRNKVPMSYIHGEKMINDYYYWNCPDCGEGYQAILLSVLRAIRETGKPPCPYCTGKKPRKGESFADAHPDLMEEFDPENTVDPYEYFPDVHTNVGWICKNDPTHKWMATFAARHNGRGKCPVCSRLYVIKGINSFADVFPQYVHLWSSENSLGPDEILFDSVTPYLWDCDDCGQDFSASTIAISRWKGCPYCNGKKLLKEFNSVAVKFPELAARWSDENEQKADEVLPSIKASYYLDCNKCGGTYLAPLQKSIAGEDECPYCSGRRLLRGYNSLADRHPDIVASYSKRNKETADQVLSTSNKFIYWDCNECGGTYMAPLQGKINGTVTCPYCSGKQLLQGYNSVAVKCPDVAARWSDQNEKTADEVLYTSSGSYYLDCRECGEPYLTRLQFAIEGIDECPYCSGKKLLIGYNSVAVKYPDIAKRWSDKNEKTADEVLYTSSGSYYLNCTKCGEPYLTGLQFAIKGKDDCPYCSGRKLLIGYNSVAVKCPDIAARWSDQNEKTADEVLYTSSGPYYLDCRECGEVYLARLQFAIEGKDGCPYCSGKKLLPGYNSVAVKYPDIAKRWSDKNEKTADEMLYTSSGSYYLNCTKCGEPYLTGLQFAIEGKDECPYCSGKKLLPGYNSVAVKYPDIAKRWSDKNEKTADEVLPTDRGSYYFDCAECEEPYLTRLEFAIEGKDECPYCSGKKLLPGYNSVAVKCPDVAARWSDQNEKTADEVLYTSSGSYYLDCRECGEVYLARLQFAIEGKDGCPYCSGKKLLPGYNSVAVKYPDIAKRWSDKNEKTADEVLPTDRGSYYLDCAECSGTYLTKLQIVIAGEDECPYCSGQRVLPGYNSVAVKYPDIAKRWSDKNEKTADEVLPTDRGSYYLNCPECGGTYPTKLQEAIAGEDACPYCSDRKVLPGYNSFDVKHPDLMEEWDYRANYVLADPKQIKDTCITRVWWICRKNQDHVYPMTVKNRVMYEKRGREACPYCKGRRRKLSHFMPKPKFDNEWDD